MDDISSPSPAPPATWLPPERRRSSGVFQTGRKAPRRTSDGDAWIDGGPRGSYPQPTAVSPQRNVMSIQPFSKFIVTPQFIFQNRVVRVEKNNEMLYVMSIQPLDI